MAPPPPHLQMGQTQTQPPSQTLQVKLALVQGQVARQPVHRQVLHQLTSSVHQRETILG